MHFYSERCIEGLRGGPGEEVLEELRAAVPRRVVQRAVAGPVHLGWGGQGSFFRLSDTKVQPKFTTRR